MSHKCHTNVTQMSHKCHTDVIQMNYSFLPYLKESWWNNFFKITIVKVCSKKVFSIFALKKAESVVFSIVPCKIVKHVVSHSDSNELLTRSFDTFN